MAQPPLEKEGNGPVSQPPHSLVPKAFETPRVAVQAAADVKVLTISTPHNIVGRRNKRFTNDQTAVFEIGRTVVGCATHVTAALQMPNVRDSY